MSRPERASISIKVRLKHGDEQSFLEAFADNVSRTGMFVATNQAQPPGTRVRFEYRLKDDTRVMRGIGVVRWVRGAAGDGSGQPAGMGIQFIDLDADTEILVHRIVERFGEGRLAPHSRGRTPVSPKKSSVPGRSEKSPATAPRLDAEEAHALDTLFGEESQALAGATPQGERAIALPAQASLTIDLGGATPRIGGAGVDTTDSPWMQGDQPLAPGEFLALSNLVRSDMHARMLTRRIPFAFELEAGGVRIAGGKTVEDILRDTVTQLIETAGVDVSSVVDVVVPPDTAHALRRAIEDHLLLCGATEVLFSTAPEAIVAALRADGPVAGPVFVMEIGAFCVRCALLGTDGQLLAHWTTFAGSGAHVESLLVAEAGRALLAEHAIDIGEAPELEAAATAQVQAYRQQGSSEQVLVLSLAGVSVEVPPRRVAKWLHPVHEALADVFYGLLNQQNLVAESITQVFVLVDTRLWPGLEKVVPALLARQCTVLARPLIHPSASEAGILGTASGRRVL